jgi:N-acetylmuramoyl-L-alanine amidase
MRYLGITLATSALLATLFTAWKPASLDPSEVVGRILDFAIGGGSSETTPVTSDLSSQPQEQKVGVIAGHSGPHPEFGFVDPGATCDDGFTELEINLTVADLVAEGLSASGIEVDRLEEFDDRLDEYKASALVSIHADACYFINDVATGYKVARARDSAVPDLSQRLATCIIDRYDRSTGMRFHAGSITQDMTEYHTFYEIDTFTPAVIIEMGFLYLDRGFLTEEPELVARGIIDGILCYLNNEPASYPGE